MKSYYILLLTFALSNSKILKEEDPCRPPDGKFGNCKKFDDCPAARYDLEINNIWPSKCNIDSELICCEDAGIETTDATSIEAPEEHDTNYGRISRKKCEEYSNWLESPTSSSGNKKIQGSCGFSIDPPLAGSEKAGHLEFPHMANLGYEINSALEYQCSASLISEQYLLAPAHCISNGYASKLKIAKLSGDDRKFQILIKIVEMIAHPEYNPPHKYNDIALLKLEKPLRFTDYIRPACLQTEKDIKETQEGVESFFRNGGVNIYKRRLPFTNQSLCSKIYKRMFSLQRGLDDDSMICGGEIGGNVKACQDNYGGPLQIIKQNPSCMYSIVGVPSFGIKCGELPDVYTRVSNYIPWIESIVWADEE